MKKIYPICWFLMLASWADAQQISTLQLKLEPHLFKSFDGREVQAELGSFFVPENRSVQGSRNIKLSFIRFKCTGNRAGSPIVYLAGGPGGAGSFTAKGPRFNLFMAMREFGDVIAFDQRGTGMSNSLEPCDPKQPFDFSNPGDPDQMIATVRENLKQCLSFWQQKGVDVTAYNNIENADDIDDLRKALGVPKVTLWGISYGTQLAFTYIRRHEAQTDKLILAGLEATGDNIKRPLHTDNFLANVEKALAADPEASKAYPPLRELMHTVFENLTHRPASVVIKNSKGVDVTVGISKFDLQLVTSFFLLKNPSDQAKLPRIFKKMRDGDYSDVGKMVYDLKSYGSSSRFYGMGLLMDAMTGVTEEQMKKIEVESKASVLGRSTNFPFPDIARGLALPDLGDAYRKDVTSDVPGLFLNGTLDGRTYVEDARRIAENFSKVKLVIVVNGGHDVFEQSTAVQDLILNYMRGQQIPSQLTLDAPRFALK